MKYKYIIKTSMYEELLEEIIFAFDFLIISNILNLI